MQKGKWVWRGGVERGKWVWRGRWVWRGVNRCGGGGVERVNGCGGGGVERDKWVWRRVEGVGETRCSRLLFIQCHGSAAHATVSHHKYKQAIIKIKMQ